MTRFHLWIIAALMAFGASSAAICAALFLGLGYTGVGYSFAGGASAIVFGISTLKAGIIIRRPA